MITAEEVFDQKAPLPDIVALQTRQVGLEGTGQITLRHLVTEALRMRPNRIVVGEVRREEALDLLIALNSGVPGMGTVHANSAREAITKICTLPLLAGENIGSGFVVPTVAGSIDLVVHVATDQHGRRMVREIVAVPGRVEGHVVALEAGVRASPRPTRSGGRLPAARGALRGDRRRRPCAAGRGDGAGGLMGLLIGLAFGIGVSLS